MEQRLDQENDQFVQAVSLLILALSLEEPRRSEILAKVEEIGETKWNPVKD